MVSKRWDMDCWEWGGAHRKMYKVFNKQRDLGHECGAQSPSPGPPYESGVVEWILGGDFVCIAFFI